MATESANQPRLPPQPTPPADAAAAPERSRGIATLRPEHLYKAVALFFLFFFVYRFFEAITQTLLLVYAASILAVALNPIAKRIPLARRWVAGLIGMAVIATIGLLLWLAIPALIAQIRDFAARAPEFQAQLEGWGEWLRAETGLNVRLVGEQVAQTARNMFQDGATQNLFGRARGLLEVLLVPLIVLIGGLYALASPNDRLLLPLLRVVPRHRRAAFYRIFKLLGERLLGWIRGTLIAMVAVGLLSIAALYIIGVPYWLLLGVIVGIVEFIPIFGPWIGGVPATTIAFLDEPIKGAWTAAAILVIQQIESYLITPWVMSSAAKIHPLVTLFALILFGSIFGILGILLALPIVIFVWTIVEVLWVERAVDTDRDWIPDVVKE
ncbi:AI-2E family transporter [soil metagenome]